MIELSNLASGFIKMKKSLCKNSFFEELWPLDFLGFSYIISFVKYDNGKPEHDMSIHYVQ